MNSQSVAGILGAIIASIVLVVAIAYGPIGQFGKPAKPAAVQPAATGGPRRAGAPWAGDPGSAQSITGRRGSPCGTPRASLFSF